MRHPRPIEVPDPPAGGGEITGISYQKKDPNRCSIQLDGSFAFGLHMDLVARSGLSKGRRLTEDECRNLLNQDLYFKLLKRAFDLLAYRPRSRRELEIRLTMLDPDNRMSEPVMARLDDLGYLDDEAFARQFVSGKLASGKVGPERIRQELRSRGVATDITDRVLDAETDPEEERRRLDALVEKAQKRYTSVSTDLERQRKMTGWLRRRGYSFELIRQALERNNHR